MHIRKLELQGFKSFADRAAFVFGDGISGVVGPNGCGKSNVIDAVKWCIGEQSAKSLRGDTMSDVIFHGASGRAALNFAEVTLTFGAGDAPFPGQWQRFAELEVTRRLYRDGTSEYRINQDRVRLRDVQDLLMDSGAGNQLYSVIEQGRIGQIVHARPEQRRTLVEEAAGISRYKARREETQQKLDATRAALERVQDLADELGRQLKGAERAVQKVARWRVLRARVRQEDVVVGLARCAGLLADRRALAERLRAQAAEQAEADRVLQRVDVELAERRASQERLEEEGGRVRDRLAELEAQRRVEESAAQYLAREREQAAARLVRLEADQQAAREERDAAERDAGTARTQRTEAEAGLARARAVASEAGAMAQAAGDEERQARQDLERARAASMGAYQAAVRARGDIQRIAARRGDLDARAARTREALEALGQAGGHADEELARVADQVREADARVADARAAVEAEVARGREALAEARAGVAALEQAREAAGRALQDAERVLTESVRARAGLAARLEAVEDGIRRNADVPDGLRPALAVPGVIGVLAAMLDVPEAVERLLATALEGGLDTVLVPDPATALRVASSVKGARARVLVVGDDGAGGHPPSRPPPGGDLRGRGAALAEPGSAPPSADASSPRAPLEAPDGANRGGVPATPPDAFADVAGPPHAREALARLLGDCVIVDAVTELHAAWAPGRRIVARDGGLLRPDGVLVVGADGAAGTAALRRRREAAALRTELEGHDARVAAARAAVDTARAEQESRAQGVRDARAALDTAAAAGSAAADVARTTLRERENQAAEARHRLKGREADRARQRQEAQRLAAEGGQHVADRAALDTEEQRATQATVTAEAEHQRAEEAARAAQLTLERVEPRVREARERLQGARTEADALQREATRAGEAERSAAARVERAAGRGALIAKERSDLETRQDASAGETAAVAGRLQALGEQMGEVRVQLDHVRARIVEEKERVRASDEAVRAARQRRDTVRDAATGLEARLAEVRVHLEQVRADVEPRYELSLPGLLDRLERDGQLILEGFEPPEDGMVREGVPALRVTAAELEADMTERAVALREQREALAKLGEVNLAAEEEYREVQQRHDDIERQRADLRDALEIIDKAIAKINRTCRERFRETFDLVAQHYVEIYARLSGGGVGRLQLTDEDDLLTCGVEQFAQPPGKKVHTLSLLSGGEKALAAIALIFALFRVKPSPFCLLDEVDAPLDEGNGGRFNEMLKEMSRSSQFIIITHNKKTMECADVLYGVTTPEPGISRLVTVRID